MATRQRERPRAAENGSVVITANEAEHSDPPQAGPSSSLPVAGVLRLRGAAPINAPRVQWDEQVIDNEGLNKKKSKICCIYHKPKAFDESSSEDSSSTSDCCSDSAESASSEPKTACNHKHKRRRKRMTKSAGANTVTLEQTTHASNKYEQQPVYDKGKKVL